AGSGSAAPRGFKGKNIAHAGYQLRFSGVKRNQLAAKDWASRDDGKQHSGWPRVNPELGGTYGLDAGIKTMRIAADDGEIVGIFQPDSVQIGDGQVGRIGHKFAMAKGPV